VWDIENALPSTAVGSESGSHGYGLIEVRKKDNWLLAYETTCRRHMFGGQGLIPGARSLLKIVNRARRATNDDWRLNEWRAET
jgi:hypothetical protein